MIALARRLMLAIACCLPAAHASAQHDNPVDHLLLLGKVWGFLKYHHPAVTDGDVDWDPALRPVAERIRLARSPAQAREILGDWVDSLPPVQGPASADPLPPSTAWIADTRDLGPRLSQQLQAVFHHRSRGPGQQHVMRTANGSLEFTHESDTPDEEDRLLAFFRLWNIVRYWYPYHGDTHLADWDAAARAHLDAAVNARDRQGHVLALFRFLAKLGDSHTSLWNVIPMQPPFGRCRAPIDARPLEDGRIVVGLSPPPGSTLEPGDEVLAVDGQDTASLMADWRPFYAASNEAARRRDMAAALTKGDCGPMRLRVQRGDAAPHEVTLRRVRQPRVAPSHAHPADAPPALDNGICYWNAALLRADEIPGLVARCAGHRGIVVDLRTYPSDYLVHALAGHFIDAPVPFSRVSFPDVATPGRTAFSLTQVVQPRQPYHPGRLAVLIDETTQSQAEYTAMPLRATGRARFYGTATAGADGDVSFFDLPGGLRTGISTLGIAYPDGSPTQRIGIVPDVAVKTTAAGLRARRDEVLEAAVADLLR